MVRIPTWRQTEDRGQAGDAAASPAPGETTTADGRATAGGGPRQTTMEQGRASNVAVADRTAPAAVGRVAPEDREVVEEPVRLKRPRITPSAVLCLVFALGALFSDLTGVLAPLGIALGLVGVLFGLVAFATTRPRHVIGRGLTIFGLLCALGAIVLGAAMMTGHVAGLSEHVDQAARLRHWLDAHITWLTGR